MCVCEMLKSLHLSFSIVTHREMYLELEPLTPDIKPGLWDLGGAGEGLPRHRDGLTTRVMFYPLKPAEETDLRSDLSTATPNTEADTREHQATSGVKHVRCKVSQIGRKTGHCSFLPPFFFTLALLLFRVHIIRSRHSASRFYLA